MSIFVGIDVAKKSFDVAALSDSGKYKTKAKLINTAPGYLELEAWLDKHAEPNCWVVMEATSVYHQALAEFLHDKGYRVCVINPAVIHAFGKYELRRVKTDKADSKLIAEYAQSKQMKLRAWVPEALARRRLRALVRRLSDLNQLRQMEENRLDVSDDSVLGSIRSVISHLDHEIAETKKAIKNHIDDDPDLRKNRDLMITIKGLGETTASMLLGELGDPLMFKGARALVAFAGLNPLVNQSGEWTGPTPISKTGSARIRTGLFMPGIVSIRWNPAIKALAERMRSNGKAPLQIVCAAMRKLLHIVYGVLKSGKPFDPQLGLAQ